LTPQLVLTNHDQVQQSVFEDWWSGPTDHRGMRSGQKKTRKNNNNNNNNTKPLRSSLGGAFSVAVHDLGNLPSGTLQHVSALYLL